MKQTNIFNWIVGKTSKTAGESSSTKIVCTDFYEAAKEYCLRELAFLTCVNMIGNAVGKCDFKTYKEGKEFKGAEAYLWNIEPNINQNSTMFINKLITKLYLHNEALVIATKGLDGTERLAIADTFILNGNYPSKENEYQSVTVGDFSYNKTFRENEVLHLRLKQKDIKIVLDLVYDSYGKMIAAAKSDYEYQLGRHLKVHVDQMAQGGEEWEKRFAEIMNNQVKPFMQSGNGVLPEFNGYEYSEFGAAGGKDSRDIREMYNDIFDFTAKAFNIPTVLIGGEVAGTKEAFNHWLTICIDPLCDQLEEEINRKRYGRKEWEKGNYLRIDTSSLIHFDLFSNATNVDKLIASGAFSVNEVRKAAGQTPIDKEWADKHMITKNSHDHRRSVKTT